MRHGKRWTVFVALALALVLIVAVALPRESPKGPTGQWMAAAGLTPRFETVDGARLRYVRTGSGPAVVLLHGFASSIVTWRDTIRRWPPTTTSWPWPPELAGSAIRLDLSPSDYPGWSSVSWTGCHPALVVGNSMAAARIRWPPAPERVDRVVMSDSAGFKHSKAALVFRVTAWKPAARTWSPAHTPGMVTAGLRQVFHEIGW